MHIAPEYVTQTQRLALGLVPLDAVRGGRVPHPVRIEVEGPLPRPLRRRQEPYRHDMAAGAIRPVMSRHNSCLHVLLYHKALVGTETIDLRLYDHYRRYVPRRLSIPLLTEEQAENQPYTFRVRRPALFPGAAYDVSKRLTGLRGRVLRGGKPMRWARVEAVLPNGSSDPPRIGAHGDDRGEFLLLLEPLPAPVGALDDPLPVTVKIYGPETAPSPDRLELPNEDALWDAPLERVPAPGNPDPVSTGRQRPEQYATNPLVERVIPFALGRTISRIDGVNDFIVP